MNKITNPTIAVNNYKNITELNKDLTCRGCQACSLGFQPEINGCCVSRGNPDNKLMIIGEAPGKHEDADGAPFTGPAGKLLDKIWSSVGWDTNDWYLTNVCLCRPYMPKGSGKENYTPKADQIKTCRPYLLKQIELIRPKIVVTLGKTATEAIMGRIQSMSSVRGKSIRALHRECDHKHRIFPMIHPAAILRDPNAPYKLQTWDDIRNLKQIVTELER